MTDNLGKFMDDFAELVRMAQSRHRPPQGEQLVDALAGHLGEPPHGLPVVVEEIPAHRFVDADIILAGIAADDPGSRLIGIGGGDHRHHLSFSDMLSQTEMHPPFPLAQPDYTNLAVGPAEQRQVIALGVWLLTFSGVPLAVLQRQANPGYGRPTALLEVLSPKPQAAADFLAAIRIQMQTQSVLKGQVVSLSVDDFGSNSAGVTYHARPELTSSDIILPEGLLSRVTDHAVGLGEHRAQLKALGQHLKRGILLHGPPGTGKTHTVRYLLSKSGGTTSIILSGGSLAYISEAARMARALQPSMVILEDCDLIAEDRSFGHGPQPLLFEVLDAMDGLDDDADVAFVLTTNRVDMLERALAQRPGRVDLAVEIPLPEAEERAALLNLYAKDIGFSPCAITEAAEGTDGTTASFARELVRRSVVAAALSGERVADKHLLTAVKELMADGAALTRSLLGSGGHGRHEGEPDDDDEDFGTYGPPGASPGYFAYAPLSGVALGQASVVSRGSSSLPPEADPPPEADS